MKSVDQQAGRGGEEGKEGNIINFIHLLCTKEYSTSLHKRWIEQGQQATVCYVINVT